jgi:hypothetical protein
VKACLKTLFDNTYLLVAKDTMSKALMKLRLQKDMNQQIQKENYELRMQLQSLEEEKQRLQDQLICHEEFLRGIIHELERELQAKDQILAQFHEAGKVEKERSPMQERLSPTKGLQIVTEEDDSSYSSSPRQDGEFSRMDEVRRNSNEEVLHKQLVLPSIPGKGIKCKASPGRDEHSNEGMKTFPTSKTGMNLWSMYPCVFCGTNNHCMVKCGKRQSLQEKPSKKEARRQRSFSKTEE